MVVVHSVPLAAQPAPCETLAARADARLRGHVVGYGGFRPGAAHAVHHRLLPLNFTTVIVDLDAASAVVTGPRAEPSAAPGALWGRGVSVGLTPAGAAALLGAPMAELAGATVPLSDVDIRLAGLVERLAAAPAWPDRFALLDRVLAGRLDSGATVPPAVVTRAWRRLQEPAAPRIGALAASLGISRRHLEQGFRRWIGLAPGAVARVARFQRAVGLLSAGVPPARIAAEAGYTDQPHLTRDVRALSGLTPVRLRAFVQYRGPAAV
jgi:AraC-like DNA-binding protein